MEVFLRVNGGALLAHCVLKLPSEATARATTQAVLSRQIVSSSIRP
jgi:hypothetical protein